MRHTGVVKKDKCTDFTRLIWQRREVGNEDRRGKNSVQSFEIAPQHGTFDKLINRDSIRT